VSPPSGPRTIRRVPCPAFPPPAGFSRDGALVWVRWPWGGLPPDAGFVEKLPQPGPEQARVSRTKPIWSRRLFLISTPLGSTQTRCVTYKVARQLVFPPLPLVKPASPGPAPPMARCQSDTPGKMGCRMVSFFLPITKATVFPECLFPPARPRPVRPHLLTTKSRTTQQNYNTTTQAGFID